VTGLLSCSTAGPTRLCSFSTAVRDLRWAEVGCSGRQHTNCDVLPVAADHNPGQPKRKRSQQVRRGPTRYSPGKTAGPFEGVEGQVTATAPKFQ
jgi:hypothetical protein